MKDNFLIILLLFVCVVMTQCVKEKRIVEELIVSSIPKEKDTCIVDLTQLPFLWDTVYFFSGRVDSPFEIKRITGLTDYFTVDDPGPRILFIKDGRLVYEETWYTTSHYNYYILYENNDSCIAFPNQTPFLTVKRSHGKELEFFTVRNIDINKIIKEGEKTTEH